MAYAGDLNERARSLRQGIAKLSNDPTLTLGNNYSSGTAQSLAQQQAELADIQNQINQSDTDRTLALFDKYSPNVSEDADRSTINDLFNTQQDQQLKALNDGFAQQRGQAIDEAAVAGNLRQPSFMSSQLNSIDALKGKAIEQLFAELGIGRNQAILNSNTQNRQLGFNKAQAASGIMQGGQQFGQTLDFNRSNSNANNDLNRRQMDLNDLFNRDKLNLSKEQFDDSKPGGWDRAGQAMGLFKGFTGGAKDLFGSGGALR